MAQETQARCDSIIIVTVVVVAVSALPIVGGNKSPRASDGALEGGQ